MRSDPQWWHTIDLPGGRVTPGGWDLRGAAPRMPWPGDLRGLRCLDVGTMDGFWAFEMERRGAAGVALAAVRSVCAGAVIVLETVSLPLCAVPSPLARLNATRRRRASA